MSASARAAREAKLRREKQKRTVILCSAAVLFFAVAVWFALVWSGSARLDEDLAAAVERRQELSETIERKNLILENEISNRVICQVAEEKLYMQRPAAVKTVSIYLPQRTGSQTAGR
jgi:cell division protein FtsL